MKESTTKTIVFIFY